jgi:hypothetical protein
MPWRQEPTKDVAGSEMLRGVASKRSYIDSLTGITESESGKSSEALKITGRPELLKMKKLDRDLESESN